MSTIVSAEARVTVSDYDKHLAVVKKNSLDFSTWVLLLKACDTEPDYNRIRAAFDAFLSHYPFCYGYWQKYAGHTVRYAAQNALGTEPVLKIYERAVEAVRYSVDMWGHYCNYLASVASTTEDEMRTLYDRALVAVGSAPTANTCKTNQLWNSVLRFELETTKNQTKVGHVFHRLLQSGCNGFEAYMKRYEEWAKSPAANLESPDGAISDADLAQLKLGIRGAPPDNFGELSRTEQIIFCVRTCQQQTLADHTARALYEHQLGYYFHVKPLSETELGAWRTYLQYEISQEKAASEAAAAMGPESAGSDDTVANAARRTSALFERCMIRCANYPEFWLMYADYVAEKGAPSSAVVAVYRRCTEVHLPHHPAPRLALADYFETAGKIDATKAEYAKVQSLHPKMVQGALAFSNFHRRHNNSAAAEEVLVKALAANTVADPVQPESAAEIGGAPAARSPLASSAAGFLAVHLANFRLHVKKDIGAARHTFEAHLAANAMNADFVAAYVAFEIAHTGAATCAGQGIDAIFANLVAPESRVEPGLQQSLWRRRVELAHDFGVGYTIQTLKALRQERDVAIERLSSTAPLGGKRGSDSDGGSAKRARANSTEQVNGQAATPAAAPNPATTTAATAAVTPSVAATNGAQYPAYGQQHAYTPQQQHAAYSQAYGQQSAQQDPALAAQWAAYYAQQRQQQQPQQAAYGGYPATR